MEFQTPEQSTLLKNWKILVIDDDEDDLILVKEMLRNAKGRKYDIHWASTFEKGREALLSNHYNAVLVDYDLGRYSGIDLIREANERGYAAPLILFTGRGSYEIDVEAMQAGATLYLTKSEANPLLLERAIRYAIELKQKEQSLRESEAALHISEERFNRAFNTNPVPQVISRLENGLIEDVNQSFVQLFGYERREMVGKTSLELNLFVNPADRQEAIRQIQAEKAIRDFELDIRTKSGKIRQASLSAEIITIGNESLLLTVVQDITERKQAEAEREQLLKENRIRADQLETVVQALPVGVWVTDADGRILMKNQQSDLIWVGDAPLSASIDAYQEYQSWDAVTGRQIQTEEYPLAIALRTGQPVAPVEHVIRRFDGSEGSVLVSVRPFKDSEGRVTGAVAINVDITERKKLENELRQREELLEAFFTNSPSILNIVDEDLRYVKTGNLTPSFFGLDRHAIMGEAIKDLAPEFIENVGPVMRRVIDTGQPEQREVQFPVFGSGGEKTSWQVSFFPIPLPEGKTGVGIIGLDITALKKAEEALRESNEALQIVLAQAEQGRLLLKALLEHVPEGITITGGPPDFPIEQVSRYGLELTRNPTNSELLGKPAGQHQSDWGIFLADGETLPSQEQMPLYRASHFGETVRNEEMVIRAQNGDWITVLVNAAPIRDEQGQIKGAINSWRDISERKQAEKALLEREEMLQLALSAGNAGAWSWDLTTNTVRWSDEYYRIFGFEPGTIEPTEEAGFGRIHPEDRLRIEVVTQEAIVQGKKIDEVHRVVWPDGSVHWVRGLSQVFSDPQGKPNRLAGIALDVTSEKQEEEMLAKYAEQLARSNQELAQFAFIASHDLQEPLRKIKQFGNTLRMKLMGKLDTDTQDNFERMLHAVDRMQRMIEDLLELSRVNTQGQPFVAVDLSQVAAEVVSDLEALIHRTKGQVIIEPLPVIQADPMQMYQVLQNIIGNALKFHKPDSTLVVKVTSEILKEGTQAVQKVLIRIEDNGIGFEEDQLAQILKPFGRLHGRSEYEGTGMGLAIVKKIIDRHQGEIMAKSHPGQSSTFIITLPIKQTG